MGYKLISIVREESTNTTFYSIQRDSDKVIRDVSLDTILKCINDLDNVSIDNEGNLILPEDVNSIIVWNIKNTGGKLIKGLNDLETYCLKNNMQDKLENYNLGNNILRASEICYSSNKWVRVKCKDCDYEHETILNWYIHSHNYICIRCATEQGKSAPYCIPGVNDIYTKCIKEGKEYLLDEYDDVLDVHEISFGSSEKMQWRCKFGHTWMAAPSVRINKGTNCPYCQGSQTSKTERALCNWFKENNIRIKEREKIDGEEFDIHLIDYNILIEVNSEHTHSTTDKIERDNNKREIANKSNKILIVLLELYNKSEETTLYYDIKFSNRKGYLDELLNKLSKKLNEYNINIKSTISKESIISANKNDVPFERSLVGIYGNKIEEIWSPLNGVEPSRIFANSRKYVTLLCVTCNEEYEIRADAIKQSWTKDTKGCPYCSNKKVREGVNDLLTLEPELCKDWHPDNLLKPSKILVHSNKMAKWKCINCGNEWETIINNRTGVNRTGCTKCGRRIL